MCYSLGYVAAGSVMILTALYLANKEQRKPEQHAWVYDGEVAKLSLLVVVDQNDISPSYETNDTTAPTGL